MRSMQCLIYLDNLQGTFGPKQQPSNVALKTSKTFPKALLFRMLRENLPLLLVATP